MIAQSWRAAKSCGGWLHRPEHIVAAGARAHEKKQPGHLEVWEAWQFIQERIVLAPFGQQRCLLESVVPQGGAEHVDAL